MSKFSIGEKAKLIAIKRSYLTGLEVEIVNIGTTTMEGNYADYRIYIPGHKSPAPDGMWTCNEWQLIKKRPPKTSSDIEETRKYGPGQWDLMPWSPKEKKNVFSHEDN